jgi:hypothetical protein
LRTRVAEATREPLAQTADDIRADARTLQRNVSCPDGAALVQ